MEIHDLKDAKKIGVLGGTFDPIHYGHLVLAEEARHKLGLDAVIFMPAGQPPHKVHGYGRVVSDAEKRFGMVVAATAGNPYFCVSRLEIERSGNSYTIDTIKNLQNSLPQAAIYFIMGADAFFEIETWRDADELLTAREFVAATRTGESAKRLKRKINKLTNEYGARIHYLEIPGLDISSTVLRERAHSGAGLKYLVPQRVERYIMEHGLYVQNEMELWHGSVKMLLKKMLNRERYTHTLGVCEEAVRLARFYGANVEKAYTAALLHDCARGLTTQQQLDYCTQNDIQLDGYMLANHGTIHALVGAHIARHTFGVTDKNILNAIKRHTIGNKKMSLIDKIVCVADVTEPNRHYTYPNTDEVRKAAARDINAALVLAIHGKTEHLPAIHPKSIKMMKKYGGYK